MTRNALLCAALLWGSSFAAPPAATDAAPESGSRANSVSSTAAKGRRLTGRFLHITDFHPDPFYKTYSSTKEDSACHRHRGPAGIYGAETSGCDAPYSLINQTFDWISDNIKDDIDFIIWTGDSARHDNDEKLPRTQKQILRQNQFMVDKFTEVFGHSKDKDGRANQWAVPVVPTFGNNDIMPHNIFLAGPNRWTMKYLDIWRSFIPEAQRHQFQQGGWFSVEVIPGKLAAISLNTMYFFSSNSGVDGCGSKREPGYEHMEWLRIQLQILRERNMKAILMGHVPPARVDSKESWDETCWQKYTLWQQQFRDVIVGNLYGHMNIDHFVLQDFDELNKDTKKGRMPAGLERATVQGENDIALFEDGEVTVASASDYLLDLREAWAELPAPPPKSNKARAVSVLYGDEDGEDSLWGWLVSKMVGPSKQARKNEKKKYFKEIGGKFAERYSISHVSPSVVPNYYPTLRIIEYNITGLEDMVISPDANIWNLSQVDQQSLLVDTDPVDDDDYLREVETTLKRKKGKKGKKGPKKYKFKVPEGPSETSPPGPAYSPQTLTWTRFVQYYANLTRINNDFVEPTNNTQSNNQQSPRTIFGLNLSEAGQVEPLRWKEGKHHKHQGKQPRPEPHPLDFYYEIEYDTKKDRKFPDLTVRHWVEYARRIAGEPSTTIDVDAKEDISNTIDVEVGNDGKDEDAEEDDDQIHQTGKKHKKKKGKKKKHKHHKASKEWFTFVKRAFVGTMDPREIEQIFGDAKDGSSTVVDEVMEL